MQQNPVSLEGKPTRDNLMMSSAKLSEREILVLINDYIGVDQGYLRGFSYSFHDEFYARFCNLDIDVAKARLEHGTTRLTFAGILRDAEPPDQAKIVMGVFEYLKLNDDQGPIEAKRRAAHELLTSAVGRIRGQPVMVDDLAIRHETIDRAIRDADGEVFTWALEITAAFVAAPIGENFFDGDAAPQESAVLAIGREQDVGRSHCAGGAD